MTIETRDAEFKGGRINDFTTMRVTDDAYYFTGIGMTFVSDDVSCTIADGTEIKISKRLTADGIRIHEMVLRPSR